MATFDYTKFVDLAAKLLAKYGYEIDTVRNTVGAYDPTLNKVTAGSPISGTYNAVVLPVIEENLAGMDFKPEAEGFALSDCRIVYADAKTATFAPQPEDILDIGDTFTWRILSTSKISPIGIDILYIIGIVKQ